MTVEQIVKEYLESHGYDGLYDTDCGCKKDDLIPCEYEYIKSCKPGHIKYGVGIYESDWTIGPDNPKPKYKPTKHKSAENSIEFYRCPACQYPINGIFESKYRNCSFCGVILDWTEDEK